MHDMATILSAAGGAPALATALGIHRTAVLRWTRVPARRVRDVARITGIPAPLLRPDLAEIFAAPAQANDDTQPRADGMHETAIEERQ